MRADERMDLVLRGAEEAVTRDELRALLAKGGTPRAYVGLEPSGLMHIGTGFVIASKVSKASTVARIRRALTIMGRKEEEADLDASTLIYPAMQVADIRWMDLDLALGGMDQRHAHMLYRDVAPKLGWKQVVALHTPLLPGLQGGGRMDPIAGKMSKSRPDACVLINDPPAEVRRKVSKAYCPAKETEGNPVLDIARMILFPRRGELRVERDPKYGG